MTEKVAPRWFDRLGQVMPTAPTTYVHAWRNTSDSPVYGYSIGGEGWLDGGRDRRLYKTRLAAVVATWEWWLR